MKKLIVTILVIIGLFILLVTGLMTAAIAALLNLTLGEALGFLCLLIVVFMIFK